MVLRALQLAESERIIVHPDRFPCAVITLHARTDREASSSGKGHPMPADIRPCWW